MIPKRLTDEDVIKYKKTHNIKLVTKWDRTFLDIAHIIAKHSTCAKHQVGAVLVKDRRIISVGYNGVPSGENHCNDIFKGKNFEDDYWSKEHKKFQLANEIHAEMNAIAYAASNGISTKNTVMYCTLSPCANCVKLMITAGVKKIFYSKKYSDISGLDILAKMQIDAIYVP